MGVAAGRSVDARSDNNGAGSYMGAGLSTLLAVMKIAEVWARRLRIRIDARLDAWGAGSGHTIYVRNLGESPVTVEYWAVCGVLGPRWLWRLRPSKILVDARDVGFESGRIPERDSLKLNFQDANYFNADWKEDEGSRIYLRLSIAGRMIGALWCKVRR